MAGYGSPPAHALAAVVALTLVGASLASAGGPPDVTASQNREQTSFLISRTPDGQVPNGPSSNAVISGDRRWARVIAFESEASDLVSGDANGLKDVFAIRRAGSFGNNGSPWIAGDAVLLSRGRGGAPANGPSHSAAVDGNFRNAARCVAFLSEASNLVGGDTNGRADAFLSRGPGGAPRRVSLRGRRRQFRRATTAVAVAGDCSAVAFVSAGRLYVRRGSRTRRIRHRGRAEHPSFAQGGPDRDLVFSAGGRVYLLRNGRGRPRVVARGRNPGYNGERRQVVAYEQERGGATQIVARDLGGPERLISGVGGQVGNADSRNPMVVNSGFYVAFESEASNLVTHPTGRRDDENGQPDIYLYTQVRDLTFAQSVDDDARIQPGGGRGTALNWYANYVLFDAPAPLGSVDGVRQVFMRYVGAV